MTRHKPHIAQCLVTGLGRGGTDLLMERVRYTRAFGSAASVEDRRSFEQPQLPGRYGTKLTTESPAAACYPGLEPVIAARGARQRLRNVRGGADGSTT